MCDHSMGALYVSTLCDHENSTSVLGPDVAEHRKVRKLARTSVLGPDVAEHRKVRKLPGKLDFSSWAGCCSAKNVKKARVLL